VPGERCQKFFGEMPFFGDKDPRSGDAPRSTSWIRLNSRTSSPQWWVPNQIEEVWNFHIGGYQVCEKWLKDRQAKGGKNPRPGRVLTPRDLAHYQKIVVALKETIRLMQEIEVVIERHGGWPRAFATK